LQHRGADDLFDGLVVDDLVAAQDAVMAVAGERVERHVGDDADIRHGLLDRRRRAVDQVVGFENVRAGFVAKVHLDIGEGGDGWNPQIGGFPGCLDRLVDRHAVHARHGGDRLDNAFAGNDEDRPDQVIHGQAVLLHEAAGPVGLAVAAHAAVTGDVINQMCLVLHGFGPCPVSSFAAG